MLLLLLLLLLLSLLLRVLLLLSLLLPLFVLLYCVGDNRGGARPGDPFGREALAFSREKLMQRNVELRVTDMDKNGVALGFLYLGTGKDKRNFAVDIVKVCMCVFFVLKRYFYPSTCSTFSVRAGSSACPISREISSVTVSYTHLTLPTIYSV